MAIEITKLTKPTSSDNPYEFLKWLNDNALEYFPNGFDIDALTVRSMIGSKFVISIPYYISTTDNRGYIYPINSNTPYYCSPTNASIAWSHVAKTNHGFALLNNAEGTVWFVSKTNMNTTCVCVIGGAGYNSNVRSIQRIVFGDLEKDTIVTESTLISTSLVVKNSLRTVTNKTILTPLAFNCGTYSPYLFITPFTQRAIDTGWEIVEIDGIEYLYDGLIALKG